MQWEPHAGTLGRPVPREAARWLWRRTAIDGLSAVLEEDRTSHRPMTGSRVRRGQGNQVACRARPRERGPGPSPAPLLHSTCQPDVALLREPLLPHCPPSLLAVLTPPGLSLHPGWITASHTWSPGNKGIGGTGGTKGQEVTLHR